MKHYTLTLINRDTPNLDLQEKCQAIEEVFCHIHNGGASGRSFKDLRNYEKLDVGKDRVEVDVDETGNSWHRGVGKRCKKKHGMGAYCRGHHMFKWN